ncbi:MAG TPA: hypothetical protein VK586_12620 [Streptosporangiaceae bacterium]|nr:hypothetical protein [Streptosporangiaceae bacterium]
MRYQFRFEPAVLRQLNRFPADALDGLISVMADITMYPDDPLRSRPASRPGERRATFGGFGLVTYEIDEPGQLVIVTDVTWAG